MWKLTFAIGLTYIVLVEFDLVLRILFILYAPQSLPCLV